MILNFLKEKRELENRIRIIDELIAYVRSKTEFTDRDLLILDCRLDQHMTLEDSGKILDLTRDRARQVERKALEKMANSRAWHHKKSQNLIATLSIDWPPSEIMKYYNPSLS